MDFALFKPVLYGLGAVILRLAAQCWEALIPQNLF
jgi:hypothetical protein